MARIATVCSFLLAAAVAGCSGSDPSPSSAEPPEPNRFTKEVLLEGMNEPMQIEFDERGRVYWIERTGGVGRIDPTSGDVADLGAIPVEVIGEAGLLGLLLARDFERSRHFYAYYSIRDDSLEMRVSRFTLDGDDKIDLGSEIVLMRWPFDRGSHMGGGMTWDPDGNLYLSTGDNSDATQYTPIHWTRDGGRGQDAQRTAADTNDPRGKILRIRPEPDGSYTIPAGNLFDDDDPRTLPEIYTMGNRNPWRLSIDSKTGYVHWGEVGPDAGADSASIGPRGYDEFNIAREAGNFGWPYFIGYNRAYHAFDRSTKEYGPPFDPESPVNTSPNNTGLRDLPPARPAFLAYPYAVSKEHPVLGSGGRNAVGGPIFYPDDFAAGAERVFPAYYEGAWFVTDFVRNWIMTIRMNEDRTEVESVERFLPEIRYNSPIDMDFGPDGDLYVVEYGTQWFRQNQDARLSRIVYNAGNRTPRAAASADRTAGAVPLEVTLSSEGTVDHDGDELTYAWVVTQPDGEPMRFTEPSPTFTLDAAGEYTATLTAADPDGAEASASVAIVAGNEPPQVELEITEGNRSFYFRGETVAYDVTVGDREDGRLGQGIDAGDVAVTAEFLSTGMTPEELDQVSNLDPEASARDLRALRIMEATDCGVCHQVDEASAGPSFREVAERYARQGDAADHITEKILKGGSGVWGEAPMPAHPALTRAEARTLADYVLGLAGESAELRRLPPTGRLTTEAPADAPQDAGRGAYVLRASYTDRGAQGASPITVGDVALLRAPFLEPQTADVRSGVDFVDSRDPGFFIQEDGAYVGFEGLDLTGIDSVRVHVMTRFYTWSHFVGGTVELRLGSPEGRLVGMPVAKRPPTRSQTGGSGEGGDNAPGGPTYFQSDPAAFDAAGLNGLHDLFVVFRNDDAPEGAPLFLLNGVEFERSAQ